MTREFNAKLKKEVFGRCNNKCHICNFSIQQILNMHHIIPVNLGGKDLIENLTLLCPNCHTLVHRLAAKKFINKDKIQFLNQEYDKSAIKRLSEISTEIRKAKYNIIVNNKWRSSKLTNKPYTIKSATQLVARYNKYDSHKEKQI